MTRRPNEPGTWRIGRIAGADLLIRPSLLLMGAFLVVIFAPRFADGEHNQYLVALGLVIALYVSIVIHEIAHLVLARSHGLEVSRITLHLLGGETHIEGDSRRPWQEFSTAVVGPLASLVVGLISLWVSGWTDGPVSAVAASLGYINIALAIFNMLPGWPLDGGRALMAVVWGLVRSESMGIRFAAWCGRLIAIALVAFGVWALLNDQHTGSIDLAVCLLAAWFLWRGSAAALAYGGRLGRVEGLHAIALAETGETQGLPTLPADISGNQLLRAIALHPAERYALLDAEGQPAGVLSTAAVEAAYRSRT